MRNRGRSLLVLAALALAAAVALTVVGVQLLARQGPGALGDTTFDVNAAFLARQVEEDGPVLFQDLLGGDRDIYVQHLGDDVRSGWHAFKATAPGQPRRCTLDWDPGARRFLDSRCGTGLTFPPDGSGLEQYKVSVTGNKLVIDLRT